MFLDETVISVKSGNGGNGIISFLRDKFVEFGGPDGGDGGKGGSIYFQVDHNMTTLVDFKFNKNFAAEDGGSGKSQNRRGKDAEDLVINVPLGTVVRDFESNKLLFDLNQKEQKVLFLKGGDGGKGNVRFKTSVKRAPKIATKGKKGAALKIKLELKMMADIALVGFPNAGKSTLINKLSNCNSKVGDYPFTTLAPKLGLVTKYDKSFVLADIPGLIEGASEGKGLGIRFLRHIERCKMIYHLVDTSFEGDLFEQYETVNAELKKYSEILYKKNQIVLATKIDLLDDKTAYEKFKEYIEAKGIKFFAISSVSGVGVEELVNYTLDILENHKYEDVESEEEVFAVTDIVAKRERLVTNIVITKDEHGNFNVEGKKVQEYIDRYMFKENEELDFIARFVKKSGIEEELKKNGIKEGDTVRVAGKEFTYIE